jgi:hypothetical protein
MGYSSDDDLRRYDEAVFAWLTFSLPDDRGILREVPKAFATPDRAFATLAKQLDARFPLPSGAKRSEDDVTLPVISVSRFGDPELDWSRFNMTPVKVGYTTDFKAVYVSPHPDPYTLTYQVDLWAKRARHANSLLTQILRRFTGDIAVIHVPISAESSEYRTWGRFRPGTQSCELINDGVLDNSDLEPGEDRNRSIRKSLTIRALAWVMKEAVARPAVRRVSMQLEDDGGEIETIVENEGRVVTLG